MTLPPFNADACCPKCAGEDIHAAYHRDGYACQFENRACGALGFLREDRPEHIFRCCRRCGYGWVEAPLNADAESALPHTQKESPIGTPGYDLSP